MLSIVSTYDLYPQSIKWGPHLVYPQPRIFYPRSAVCSICACPTTAALISGSRPPPSLIHHLSTKLFRPPLPTTVVVNTNKSNSESGENCRIDSEWLP